MDSSHCFLLIMWWVRREGGAGCGAGWAGVTGWFGNVLPVFTSSCLFGCGPGFSLTFGDNCENVASGISFLSFFFLS